MIATKRENTDRKIDVEALLWTFEQIIIIVSPWKHVFPISKAKTTFIIILNRKGQQNEVNKDFFYYHYPFE